MIAYLASDLLWASKIKGTADAIGIQARPVRSLEMLEARLADSEVKGLIVDLEAPAEVALALIRRAIEQPEGRRPRVVAFGPHVAVEALNAAGEAGADVVMTRGAFAAKMADTMREISGG